MFFIKKQVNKPFSEQSVCHTDFHSHILPEVDDGSKSVEESLLMLRMSAEQGVKRIVATPHFYAHKDNIDDFLCRRDAALDILKNAIREDADNFGEYPEIYVGAEVLYFPGISRSDSIKKLCIRGTNMLLLEMPFIQWDDKTLEEVFTIKDNLGIIPIVAHIDRYFRIQTKDILAKLFEQEVLIQANADGIISPATRKKTLKLILDEKVDFLGSDCHNSSERKPNLYEACEIILKKNGQSFIDGINDFSSFVFNEVEKEI